VIVVDASVAVSCLIKSSVSEAFFDKVLAEDRIAAPTLIEYEIGSALRRLCLTGRLDADRAGLALRSIVDFSLELYDAEMLAARMWELRQNISYYDAAYVALAETLQVPLYTTDKRLASAPQHKAQIICF
jgi:predicted nucleic acid-binding protein